MVPLLVPRARVRLLSCSFESFTRRRRRWSSARRGAAGVGCAPAPISRCPAPAAGEPGMAFGDMSPHALEARSKTAAGCPSAGSEASADHHHATRAQCDMFNYELRSGRTRGERLTTAELAGLLSPIAQRTPSDARRQSAASPSHSTRVVHARLHPRPRATTVTTLWLPSPPCAPDGCPLISRPGC